jgi:NAD(P)-dependent dehydrogenase (short-subunit alcohol dehydrogenase family)
LQLGLIADTPVEAARTALELRVWSAFSAIKHAAPQIRPDGSIVLTSGTAGPRPRGGLSVGALTCSGMEGFARALAVELAPVRVNIGARSTGARRQLVRRLRRKGSWSAGGR